MNWGEAGMVMNIFIWRLVQCTCFALYVLWNKWLTVLVPFLYFLPLTVTLIFLARKISLCKNTHEHICENMIQNNRQPICWDC